MVEPVLKACLQSASWYPTLPPGLNLPGVICGHRCRPGTGASADDGKHYGCDGQPLILFVANGAENIGNRVILDEGRHSVIGVEATAVSQGREAFEALPLLRGNTRFCDLL